MPWMKGRRPAWMIRMGLFLYDHLGRTEDLTRDQDRGAGWHCWRVNLLKAKFQKAYEYSDCWVQDSRLVVLNARDAEARGARIMTRTKVVSAEAVGGAWRVTLEDDARRRTVPAQRTGSGEWRAGHGLNRFWAQRPRPAWVLTSGWSGEAIS